MTDRRCLSCEQEFVPDTYQQRCCSEACREARRVEMRRRNNQANGRVIDRGPKNYLNPGPGETDYDRWLRRSVEY